MVPLENEYTAQNRRAGRAQLAAKPVTKGESRLVLLGFSSIGRVKGPDAYTLHDHYTLYHTLSSHESLPHPAIA